MPLDCLNAMDHAKKLEFVHKMAKLALEHTQHMDDGGTVLSGPGTATGAGGANTQAGGIGGALGTVLGTNSAYTAGAAPIQQGTSTGQLNNAYTGVQGALGQTQGITNTLTPGVGQGAATESTLSGQLANEAVGGGPNPAQSALNQQTGQNIQQEAALAAGQRGAGANAGLIASQNAQQGAATQQTAVGQAATLEAQQQLNAQTAEANLAAEQIGQGTAAVNSLNNVQQGEQTILQGANTAANNAAVSSQSSVNAANAGVAENNSKQTTSLLGSVPGGISSLAALFAKGGMVKMDKGGNVLDANARNHIAPHNFALPGGRYPIHDESHARNALARVSQYGTPEEKSKVRAAVHKKYPGIAEKKMAKGGKVKGYDDGGDVQAPVIAVDDPTKYGSGSLAPSKMEGSGFAPGAPAIGGLQGADYGSRPSSYVGQFLASNAEPMCAGGDPALMTSGGPVAAQNSSEQPTKSGDSLDNDKVPTMLSAGEIVIPRHITQSANAPALAAQFVAQTLKKKGNK